MGPLDPKPGEVAYWSCRKDLRPRLRTVLISLLLVAFAAVSPGAVTGAESRISFYIDADFTHAPDVAEAIELGFRVGLDIGAQLYDVPEAQVLRRDHRANIRRSHDTFLEAVDDPGVLAVVGGMHTPPYLAHGREMNERGMPLLLTWSAGALLTRQAEGEENFAFRLSVDDRQAAPFLVKKAARFACGRTAVIHIDNGWGKANATAMASEFIRQGLVEITPVAVRADAGESTFRSIAARIGEEEADCVIFVLNHHTGALAALELAKLDAPPRVISHWGILGGSFHTVVLETARATLRLSVLQTCALRREASRHVVARRALKVAENYGVRADALSDLTVPAAFAHGHDMALIVQAAVAEATADPRWSETPQDRRRAFRDALGMVEGPIDGILKTYLSPFSPVAHDNQSGHEALGQPDLCLARITDTGLADIHTSALVGGTSASR